MRPMKKLRMAFFEKDIEYEDVCKTINRSKTYLVQRMMAKKPFAITEIYAICNMADIPYEKIPEYFPPMERRNPCNRT